MEKRKTDDLMAFEEDRSFEQPYMKNLGNSIAID